MFFSLSLEKELSMKIEILKIQKEIFLKTYLIYLSE
jgi:hypothetical protein